MDDRNLSGSDALVGAASDASWVPTPTALTRDVDELGGLLEQCGLAQIALSSVLRLYFGQVPNVQPQQQVAVQRQLLGQVRATITAMVTTGETCAMCLRQHAAAARGVMPSVALANGGGMAN